MLVYDHIADEQMVVQAESEIFDDGFSKREGTSLPVIDEQSKYNLSRGLKNVGVVHPDSMPVETALAVDTSVSAKRVLEAGSPVLNARSAWGGIAHYATPWFGTIPDSTRHRTVA